MRKSIHTIGRIPSLLLVILLTVPLFVSCNESEDTSHPPTAQIITPLENSRFKIEEVVRFEGSGTTPNGTVADYGWNFGDQATASGQIVPHAYSEAGEYNVTLAVTDNEGHITTTSIAVTVLPSEQIRYEKAFSKMRDHCEEAGGTFNEKTCECDCGASPSGHPRTFAALPDRVTQKQVGTCVELPIFEPEGAETFTSLFLNDPEEFKTQLAKIRYFQKRPYKFDFLNATMSDSDFEALANKLDEIAPVYMDIPPRFGHHDHMYISYGVENWTSTRTLYDYIEPNEPDYETRTGYFERNGISPFISKGSSSTTLKHILAPSPDTLKAPWTFPPFTPVHPDYSTLHRLQLASEKLSEKLYQEDTRVGAETQERNEVITLDEGCHKRCIARTYFSLDPDGDHLCWYERYYVNGAILRRALFTGSKDSRTIDGMALLGRGRQVSLLITQKRKIESDALKVEWSVYDDGLNELTDNSDKFVQYPIPDMVEAGGNIGLIPPIEDAPHIVMFEDGFDVLNDAALLNCMVPGHYRSDNYVNGGSLLGWVNGAADHSEELLNAFTFFGEVLNKFSRIDEEDRRHAGPVSSLLLKDKDEYGLRLISLDPYYSINGDIMHGDAGNRVGNSRIINLSYTWPRTKESCILNGTRLDKKYLWIMAAGNSSLENPSSRCPQMLDPDHRKIVVAAREGSGLAWYSDYGTGYADIAADDDGDGTSFASPRVANVAAKIVAMHGEALTNRHVRLAILLGARVDVNNRIPVRTGGFLYEMGAFRAAQYMASLSMEEKALLIDDLPGDRTDTKRELVQETIRTSKESGQVDEDVKNQVNYLIDTGILKGIARY